jgi:hypothetical protein
MSTTDDELETLGVTPGWRPPVEDPAGDPTTRASAPQLPAEHQALPGGQSRVALPPVRLGTDIQFAGADTKIVTYELPAGTHAIGILLLSPSADWSNVAVAGGDSGFTYYGQNPKADGTQWYVFPITDALEGSFKVKLTRTAATPAAARAVAIMDAAAVFPVSPASNSMPLAVTNPFVNPLQQIRGVKSAIIQAGLVANTPVTIIGAAAAAFVTLYDLNLTFDAAAAGDFFLYDTNHNSLGIEIGETTVGPHHLNLAGLQIGLGLGLEVRSDIAAVVRGSIRYTQQ